MTQQLVAGQPTTTRARRWRDDWPGAAAAAVAAAVMWVLATQVFDVDLAVVPAADHGLKVPKRGPLTQEEVLDVLVEATLEWLVREITG